MMRFIKNEKGFTLVETVLVIALICMCFIILIPGIIKVKDNREIETLRIERAVLDKTIRQCYAIEGNYPKSLEYLENYYGLSLDRDKYTYNFTLSPGGDNYDLEILKK